MATVTREDITRVQLHVTDAVLQTGENSTLSGPAQDALLAKACAESCELFTNWLASDHWAQARSRNRTACVAEALPQGEDYARFLDSMLIETLVRAGLSADSMTANATALVVSAREAVERMARKHPRRQQLELFQEADSRVRALRADVCALAVSLKDNIGQDESTHKRTKEARRLRSREALKRTLAVIPALTLSMLTATPAQVDASVHAWTHDAAWAVSTYLIASQAQPDVHIGPLGPSGPELSPRLVCPQERVPERQALVRRHDGLAGPEPGQLPVLYYAPDDDLLMVRVVAHRRGHRDVLAVLAETLAH